MQVKAITQMDNNNLKLTIMKKEEVKVNGKPISKCSYEELIAEAKKFTETKGKGMQELRNEVIKGQRKKQESNEGEHSNDNQQIAKGVKVVVKKEDAKKESKPSELPEPKGTANQEIIKGLKAPFRTKVYLLTKNHNMSAKEAAAYLGSKNVSDARIAVKSYSSNKALQERAIKLLNGKTF